MNVRSTPLFDGERQQLVGEGVLNNWGGGFLPGNLENLQLQHAVVHSGNGAYQAQFGPIGGAGNSGFAFFQTFSSELKPLGQRSTRDLARFERFETYVRNDTGAPLLLKLEFKDYRDDLAHQAFREFALPATPAWTKVEIGLAPGSGLTTIGNPQLDRLYALSMVVSPLGNSPASGSLYIDDARLVEPGPPVNAGTAPIRQIVEVVARRQFEGLYGSRNRETGLIPNLTFDADIAALNATAGVLWALPSAVRRGWLSQQESNAYVTQLVDALEHNLNQTTYLPSRFLDLTTGDAEPEESTVDAAFVALGLHRYKSLPGLDTALRERIDQVQDRFNFAAYEGDGWRLNYVAGDGFSPFSYNGYTTEGKVISLAAEVSSAHHVPLADHWNDDDFRVLDYLVDPQNAHVVMATDDFRAPFSLALVNLFADTSDRGVDTFAQETGSSPELAVNPWQNFVNYQADVSLKLEQRGRELFYQPDAGQGGSPAGYQAYSLYNDQGQPDLFMPWSVALGLLAGADHAEEALRFMLEHDLHGPQGLADSARWSTGAAEPTLVPAWSDNWNLALSLIALLQYLDGADSGSRFFANLPDVRTALDTVFTDALPGDYNRDNRVDLADYQVWKATFNAEGNLSADGNHDGIVDALDFIVWRNHLEASVPGGSSPSGGSLAAVTEPTNLPLAAALAAWASVAWRNRRTAAA